MNSNNLEVGEHRKESSSKMVCETCGSEVDLLWDLPVDKRVFKVCEACYMGHYMNEAEGSSR